MNKAPNRHEELTQLVRAKEVVQMTKDTAVQELDAQISALRANEMIDVRMTRNEIYLLQQELKRLELPRSDALLVLSRALNEALRKDDQAFHEEVALIKKGMENERGH